MNKKIFGFGLTLLIIFFFGSFNINTIFAEDEAPVEEAAEDPVVLSGIAITAPANKLEYIVGDTLDIGGLVVTGTYSDASTAPVAISEANISGFDSSAPAIGQILTVTVDEQTATYTVDILAASDGEDTPLSVEESIVLPNGCEVADTSGEIHLFPKDTSAEYLAICAFAEALEQGFVDDIEFVDSGFGLFIQSINGIAEENTYWKLNLNSAGASVGAASLTLEAGDVVSFVLTQFDPVTFEEQTLEGSVSLTIESLDPVFNNIELPDHCVVTDSLGAIHEFPQEDSLSNFLAICALSEAQTAGHITGFGLNSSNFGLYVQSVDGIAPGETEYWALWLNDDFADCGIGCLPVDKEDVLSLILTDWMTETETTDISLRIIALASSSNEEEGGEEESGGGGGEDNGSESPDFSVPDAIAYLKGVQASNGSFADTELYTDWAAIAYAAADVSGDSRNSLLHYLESNNSVSSLLTDNERHAMTLLALDENPYSWHGVNYIEAILEEFDGQQFGDSDLVNDDIFALLPLANAGYDEDDVEISETIKFILSKQATTGSWLGSVDMTAAAVQALVPFENVEGVDAALSKSEQYLADKQGSDGGWENIFSTSWALQAESALNASWTKDGKSGLDYLASAQDEAANGGAVLPASQSSENAIWATSYAIPAGLGKTWNDIMDSVSKPKNNNGGSGGSSNDNSTDEKDSDTEGEDLGAERGPTETTLPPASLEFMPILTTNTLEKTIAAPENDTEKTEAPELPAEVSKEEITAAAVDAAPENTETYQYVYYLLGGASGLALLYLALKNIFGF